MGNLLGDLLIYIYYTLTYQSVYYYIPYHKWAIYDNLLIYY